MQASSIPRAQSPGEAGISAGAVAALAEDVIGQGLNLHSFMVIRNGLVAYEDFRKPYGPDDPHAMYSVSKSVTSIAVGFAVEEGRLRLEDKVADLLPELREYDKSENLEKLLVFHLITMSAGKRLGLTVDRTRKQWIQDFGEGIWDYAPGEGWHYCNENIYLLCAILTRVCGECVTDYLMPRLFEPLDIPRPFWEHDGHGVEVGGWGLYLRTEEMAKIAMCFLDEGRFRGRRIIPAAWARECGRAQADNSANDEVLVHGCNGYGYCFWLNAMPGSFRMDGMFSQFAMILPEYNALVVTTGGEPNMQAMQDTLWRHIPAMLEAREGDEEAVIPKLPAYEPLAEAPRFAALEAKIEGRSIRFPDSVQRLPRALGFPVSMMSSVIFFMSADKAGGIDRASFRFGEDSLKFSWSEGRERNTILCGMDGRARKCRVTLGGVEFVVACSAAWEGDKLLLRVRNVNSVASRELVFRFDGRAVRMQPHSDPSLEMLVRDVARTVEKAISNKTLASLAAGMMGQMPLMAEPLHVGYLQ